MPSRELSQAAIEMQKGWWEVRMIMNEFSMLRSFNPRLLQAGNFGFTDDEMMAALGWYGDVSSELDTHPCCLAGRKPAGFEESEAARVSHIERQLDMERQQMENPSMFPVAGRHGSHNDAEAFQAAQSAGLTPSIPGDDILTKYAGSQTAQSNAAPLSGASSEPHSAQPAGTVQVTTADGRVEYRPIATRAVSAFESDLAADGNPMAEMVRDPEVQKMLREMSHKQGTSGDKSGNSR